MVMYSESAMENVANMTLFVAAREIRDTIDELAGMENPESTDDPRDDFMSDEAFRVATVIADHLDPELDDDVPLLEKLVAAIRITACPRRHS